MNKQQLSKVDMYRAVIAICLKYPLVVAIIAAFKTAADKLAPNVAAIKAAELIEDQSSKSVARSKNNLKDLLGEITANVAAALYALASDTGNPDLLAKVNYSPTVIQNMKQEILLTVASAIHDLGVQYQKDLDAYGILPAVIDSIPGIIDSFSTAIPTPRIQQAARKAAGQTVTTLIAETSGLLRGQMDKTALILKNDNPVFYSEYHTARKIVKPGVIHTSIHGNIINGKQPVYNAFIKIEELNLTVYSNLEGKFDSDKIKNGIYNVSVGATGFVTQHFSNIQTRLGKAFKLDVRLISEVMELSKVA